MSNIVIIGAGIAGLTAAKTIREENSELDIYLIGSEDFYPYNRLKLSKSLEKDVSEEELYIKPPSWYDDNNINIIKGVSATDICPSSKTVSLSNGDKLKYYKLILANGARNFIPPVSGADKTGVFSLRTIDDSWHIRDYLKSCEKVLIVGGGVLGLENAYSLSKQGVEVYLAQRSDRLMPKQLDSGASKIIEDKLESLGIKILFDTSAEKILGDDSVEGFVDSDGIKRDIDMVIFSTGIRPNISIADDIEVSCDNGVIVDEHMKTSVDDIYAVGDITQFNGKTYGLWSVSTNQGKIAGENILGKDSIFVESCPMMSFNSLGFSVFSIGDINVEDPDYIISRDGDSYGKIFVKDDLISGAIVFDHAQSAIKLKKMIEDQEEVRKSDLESFWT